MEDEKTEMDSTSELRGESESTVRTGNSSIQKGPSTSANDKRISIDVKKGYIMAGWHSVRTVIDNDITDVPSDLGLLMELLAVLSDQHKDTTKEHRLKLADKFWIPLWHCLNIVIANKMIDSSQLPTFIQFFELIAPQAEAAYKKIELGHLMDNAPSEMPKR